MLYSTVRLILHCPSVVSRHGINYRSPKMYHCTSRGFLNFPASARGTTGEIRSGALQWFIQSHEPSAGMFLGLSPAFVSCLIINEGEFL